MSKKPTSLAPQRDSNIELFRIVTMLLIIVHHYVINSGLTSSGGPIQENPLSPTSLGLLVVGGFGKIGINCFVMITGYFMCKSNISAKKFAKLFLEVMFYRIVINTIFWLSGYSAFSVGIAARRLAPFTALTTNFTGTYIMFFLFIPFLNILIRNMTEKQHLRLTGLLIFIYVILGTLPTFSIRMNYISWFTVLYFTASYIRLYPKKFFESGKFSTLGAVLCAVLCCASILVCAWVGEKTGKHFTYYLVSDCNRVLAYLTGICFFLFFKNLKIKPSRFINTVSATTFGILLIHANSATMRIWLWQDVLHNVEMYHSKWLVPHLILSVIGIFTICCILDLLRIRFVEKPFFKLWDKCFPKINAWYASLESKLCRKLHISE